jgi:hypothetical protein
MAFRTDYTIRTPDGGLAPRSVVTVAPLSPEQLRGIAGPELVVPEAAPAAATPAPAQPAPAPGAPPPAAPAVGLPPPGPQPEGVTVEPPRSAWWSAAPVVGAVAANVLAAPLVPVNPVAAVAVRAGVSGLGAAAGETGAALAQGEPVGTALQRGGQAGLTAAATDPFAQGAVAALKPVARVVAGKLAPVAGALTELEPVLAARQTLKSVADTASKYAHRGSDYLRSSVAPLFQAQREGVVRELPVAVESLAPHARAAYDAIAASGATPRQLTEFGSVVQPFTSRGATTYDVAVGRERQLANWVVGLRERGVPAPVVEAVENFQRSLGSQLDATVAGTPGEAARAAYTQAQAQVMPTRVALATFHGTPGADLVELVGTNPTAVDAMLAGAGPAERDALATAWLNAVRQKAATTDAPAQTIAAAYEALPGVTRAALFGERQAAFESVLGAARSSTAREAVRGLMGGGGFGGVGWLGGLPAVGGTVGAVHTAANLAAGPVARRAVVDPSKASFGAALGGPAAPVVDWLGRVVPPTVRTATQVGVHGTTQRTRDIFEQTPPNVSLER